MCIVVMMLHNHYAFIMNNLGEVTYIYVETYIFWSVGAYFCRVSIQKL